MTCIRFLLLVALASFAAAAPGFPLGASFLARLDALEEHGSIVGCTDCGSVSVKVPPPPAPAPPRHDPIPQPPVHVPSLDYGLPAPPPPPNPEPVEGDVIGCVNCGGVNF